MKAVAQEYIDLITASHERLEYVRGIARFGIMKGGPENPAKVACDKNLAFFNIPPHFNAHTGVQLSF